MHCRNLETEDLPESAKKPLNSKKCPFCTGPKPFIAAANRVADHIVRKHHEDKGIISLPCPARCKLEKFYARPDARSRHRKLVCTTCVGCGESKFKSARERHAHEMSACSQVDGELKKTLEKMWNGSKNASESGCGTETGAVEGQGPSKRQRTD